jgi:3-hydroxymyristoyl/3-hydroxydecanoyl-(acyl carrier protein) dehydratase
MSGRFRSFSFVDRITRRESGRVEGQYSVPLGVHFPASLMAEAVGQLAAWSSMAQLGFAYRPVAGLASLVQYHKVPQPGCTLQLQADVERCDAEAVAYSGKAFIDGRLALELVDSVGPMLPMEEFDAPDAVRADFETLAGPGAPSGRFAGVDAPHLETTEHSAGERVRATLRVPEAAIYFDDHFPRRPVYPGTLLMDNLSTLALRLADDLPALHGSRLAVARVRDVKIRSFTAPGQALELEAHVQSSSADGAQLKLAARADGRTVATARIDVERSH